MAKHASPLRFSSQRREQLIQIVLRQCRARGQAALKNPFGEFGFARLQLQDPFLETARRDQFVDEDGFGLANAVRSARGLVFGGGIPPRVEVNHGVGGGQVQADSARFE